MAKKLLTFLGTKSYDKTIYYNENKEIEAIFAQEALYQMLDNGIEILVFLTEEARCKNWLGQGMEYEGLEEVLKRKNVKSILIL